MMKTVKGKILAGGIAFSLVVGGGLAVSANTDAGNLLKSWYEAIFGVETQEAKTNAKNHGLSKLGDLEREFNSEKNAVLQDINDTKTAKTSASTSNINDAAQEHIDSVNNTRDALLNEADDRFQDIFDTTNKEIHRLASLAETVAIGMASSEVKNAGKSAVKSVNSELDEVKANAVAELQEAIDNAKAELRADIDTRSDQLENDLKVSMDNKVEQVKENVRNIITNLADQQKQLIADAATAKENEAYAELNAVVEGINQ